MSILNLSCILVPVLFLILFIFKLIKDVNGKKIKLPDASFWLIFTLVLLILLLVSYFFIIPNLSVENIVEIVLMVGFIVTFYLLYVTFKRLSLKDEEIKTLIQINALNEKRIRELEKKVEK